MSNSNVIMNIRLNITSRIMSKRLFKILDSCKVVSIFIFIRRVILDIALMLIFSCVALTTASTCAMETICLPDFRLSRMPSIQSVASSSGQILKTMLALSPYQSKLLSIKNVSFDKGLFLRSVIWGLFPHNHF